MSEEYFVSEKDESSPNIPDRPSSWLAEGTIMINLGVIAEVELGHLHDGAQVGELEDNSSICPPRPSQVGFYAR